MDIEMVPIVALVAFFWSIVALTRTLADRSVKRKLIEAAPSPEMTRMLLSQPKQGAEFGALKWGIESVAVGIGLVIIHVTETISSQALAAGILILAGGIGLLVYYAIAARLLRNAPRADTTMLEP